MFRYHFIKFSLVYMDFFDVGYGQLRIIPLIVLINDFVAFRYHFRTMISRKILLTLSTRVWGNRNPQQDADHGAYKKRKFCFCITGVDLALEIHTLSLNVTGGSKNTGDACEKIKKNDFTGKEQSENDSVFL